MLAHGPRLGIGGHGWGYGFTAGVTLTPTPTTTVGIGYRSGINQKINGSLIHIQPPRRHRSIVNTTVNLPDIVSVGVAPALDAAVDRAGYGRVVELEPDRHVRALQLRRPGAAAASTLPFQYKDGWFFSVGAEYQWNDQLTLRGGVGFEKSPVTDQVRMPLLPDNDRLWLSVGGDLSMVAEDVVRSRLYASVREEHADRHFGGVRQSLVRPALGTYIGDVSSHVDIISVAVQVSLGQSGAGADVDALHK